MTTTLQVSHSVRDDIFIFVIVRPDEVGLTMTYLPHPNLKSKSYVVFGVSPGWSFFHFSKS